MPRYREHFYAENENENAFVPTVSNYEEEEGMNNNSEANNRNNNNENNNNENNNNENNNNENNNNENNNNENNNRNNNNNEAKKGANNSTNGANNSTNGANNSTNGANNSGGGNNNGGNNNSAPVTSNNNNNNEDEDGEDGDGFTGEIEEFGNMNMTKFPIDLILKSIFFGAIFYLLSLPEVYKMTKKCCKKLDGVLLHSVVFAILYFILSQFIN